jgi:flagellin-like hook-associated protein FlgL
LAELEAAKEESTTQGQLVKALETLETQAKAMASLRAELGESQQAFQVAQRELERVKRERDRIQGDLTMATRALELARSGKPPATATGSEPPPAPPTPPPATRPDGQKP